MNPWPDPSSTEGLVFFANAKATFNAWRERGVTDPVALGWLANTEGESGFDPNAIGDFVDANGHQLPWSPHPVGTPTAFGANMWHEVRTIVIRDGINWKGHFFHGLGFDIKAEVLARHASIERGVAAVWWELHVFAYDGWTAIKAQTDCWHAAEKIQQLFERSANSIDAVDRGLMAQRWQNHGSLIGL